MTQKRDRTGRRKSDPGTMTYRTAQDRTTVAAELPWGTQKIVPLSVLDYATPTGVFVGKSLLLDLFNLFERKLVMVTEDEPIEKLLNKSLQRGGDAYMDNLCRSLAGLSELCLPAVLASLMNWHERTELAINEKINPANENRFMLTKKLLATNYLFCLVLIDILPQLEFHGNACEVNVKLLLELAFLQVQYKDPTTLGVNHMNSLVVAETYAEVLGVLSETRFPLIHRQFMAFLSDFRKDSSPTSSHQIVSLLMAMKFIKIKTNQVEDFEVGIRFLDDLGGYFLEVKDKDVKHAVAGLLVEILLPVASQIKREANIPALISFVARLYGPTNDLVSKKQHKLAAYPLLTCLLCVSQRQFFLTNWVPFLNNALANLKNRDPRISRVALESLYRLLWVYMIRNNLDGNSSTRSRLESICGSLFPKGNRGIVPRDAPLNIFVKIIHFIAQQKLDFAFKDVIFDLLCCNRTQRSLYPERMNIGIRALMVIADGLLQKDEPPAMPKSMGPSASGTIQRMKKKTYTTRPITADVARSIGLEQYYSPCRKAFDTILRILDAQFGKPLMLTAIQKGKEPEELLGGDVKPKLDLFRTCVAAVRRFLPEPMTHVELIEIITRVTIHLDDELRNLAGITLQTIMDDFPEWRDQVITAMLQLIHQHLTDFYPTILDDSLRLLLQLLSTWKNVLTTGQKKNGEIIGLDSDKPQTIPEGSSLPPSNAISYASSLHAVEGLALVMLCQIRTQPRKLAISLLREVKTLFTMLNIEPNGTPVITVLDEATPYVVKKYIEHVPLSERMSWSLDFASVCDKISVIETDLCLVNSDRGNEYLQWDPWACALAGYTERKFLLSKCPTAVAAAWPALFARLNVVNGYVDPNNPQNESRASLLRGSKSKASSVCGEALSQDGCLSLWQKYIIMCCALAPSPANTSSLASRSFSPTSSLMESEVLRSVSSSIRGSRAPNALSLSQLVTKVSAMLRWENMTDIRDSVVFGVGCMNPYAFEALLEELSQRGILREALEKKTETNVRRRKRKDLLRLQLVRLFEVAVMRGLLQTALIDSTGSLNSLLLDFIDSMRINLESDQDRDMVIITSLRLHFAKLVALIIDSVAPTSRANLIPDERKQSLFYLFIGWCSRTIAADKKNRDKDVGSYVEQKAVLAMTRILCCGPIFEAGKSIGEDGYLYGWLEKLVSSPNPIMQVEVEEMLALMLELNESSFILDWLMQQCYCQSSNVSARCFRALVRVLSRRDFPCEFVSLFVLCQTMAGNATVTDAAVHMIEILRRQYLDSSVSMCSPLAGTTSSPTSVALRTVPEQHMIMSCDGHCYPIEQVTICRQLAKEYPHLTITIFSEVSCRLETAKSQSQGYLLSLLLPWIENIELVDPVAGEDACEGPRGWGSEEATQLLLNNLMYLTATLSVDHEHEISQLWQALAVSFPANLPSILNYLYVVTVLSHEALLPYTKRIATMLAVVVGNRIASLLLEQLTTSSDFSKLILERSEIPPYYRWKEDTGLMDKKDSSVFSKTSRNEDLEEEGRQEGIHLLPMPAYGGHYSALSGYLPPSTQPVQLFTRSQVALMLICDTVRASSDVDWTEATPRLLHSGILGLDSLRPALCRHARQTIINICLLHADPSTLSQVSGILLKNQLCRATVEPFLTDAWQLRRSSSRDVNRGESPSFTRATEEEYRDMLLHSNALFASHADLIKAIVFCLSENVDQPLWANEDATPRNWKVPSANQLICLVRHLAELLLTSMPLLPVVWTQTAMKMALNTQQRHLAGRCFQIVSSLCQPLSAWLPSLLSRLVETAGEQHEDTQAYVTDLLYCLLTSAPHLSPVSNEPPPLPCPSPTHARSTSYTPALLRQSVLCQRMVHERKDARLSLLVAEEEPWAGAALMRSKSADQLKTDGEGDEEATARMQICAMAIALLDSGLENEFLFGVHLLDKILETAGVNKRQCLQKLEKTITQLEWKGFQGAVRLVVRGSVMANAYEPSIQTIIQVLDVLDESVIGGPDALGFVVCHIVPYQLLHFDAPNQLCLAASDAIRNYCTLTLSAAGHTGDHPLSHLNTMMSQYSNKTFSKDRWQWTKCVVQYLCESIDRNLISQLIVLLSEMLERGSQSMNTYVLHMLYLLMLQRDVNDAPVYVNAQVIRVVSKHVQGNNWREASRVYKAILEQYQNSERDKMPESQSLNFILDLSIVGERRSPPSPRKAIDNSTTLKRQPPPHVRVRDRLVSLLSASGLRVGLPSAQSVVFSQSELGSAASSTERICASSQEVASTGSLPDPSASITDSFPRVFKEFDFLEAEHDTVSETAESCFGWLSTMRPRSIGEAEANYDLDVDDDEDSESAQASSDAGDANSRASRASVSSSEERTPCPSEADDIDEDDDGDDAFDELSTRMHESEIQDRLSPRTTSSRDGFDRGFPQEETHEEGSVDGSSFCCRSQVSVNYYPNNRSTHQVMVQCPHHCDAKVDQHWLSLVSEVSDDPDGELTAFATLLLTQLFRTSCSRVVSLLRDASHLFVSRPLARAFTAAQDVLAQVADCPFLFVTAQYLRGNNLLQRMKCSLYEMREHVETFNERKEQSVRVLNSVRSAYKLSALGGSSSSLNQPPSENELAKLLSKMFFQLMQMNDSLHQIIQLVQECPGSQAYSLSPAVLDHQRELLLCIPDLPIPDVSATRPEHSGDSLVLLLANRKYSEALLTVRQLRTIFGAEYGCCEQSDIDVLLLLFCLSHTLKAWALVGAGPDTMHRQTQSIREANADMVFAVRKAANEPASVSQPQRTSTVSSLNDSFAKLSYHTDM